MSGAHDTGIAPAPLAATPDPFAKLDSAALPDPSKDPFSHIDAPGGLVPAPKPWYESAAQSFAQSVLPSGASLVGMGAGAELGGGIGAAVGGPAAPVTGAIGAIAGGIGGAIAAGHVATAAQSFAFQQLPYDWQDSLGSTAQEQRTNQIQHPDASFIGGIAPYLLTMSPGGLSRAAASLPENATAWQKLAASPITAKLFSGAVQGGMELGNEKTQGAPVDWAKIGIATGFGMVFSKPNALGQRLDSLGAEIAPSVGLSPTIAQAADAKVMGPGITEAVYQGEHQQAPEPAAAAQQQARTEQSVIGEPPPGPDIHAVARQMHPELFAEYDGLQQQANDVRSWIDSEKNPDPDTIQAAKDKLDYAQGQLDNATNGFVPNRAANIPRLRAQVADAQSQYDDLNGRAQAWANGTAQETAGTQAARQHLMGINGRLAEMAPDIGAAYQRAAETPQGIATQPEPEAVPEPPSAPEPEPAVNDLGAEPPAKSIQEQHDTIVNDRAAQLQSVGQSPELAEANAQVEAAAYVAHATRFKGALGGPEDLYRAEAPTVKAGRQTEPAREFAQKPEDGQILDQTARGKIRITPQGQNVITLMRDSNASTFAHEMAHDWLERIAADSQHPAAPDDLKADAQTIHNWLGSKQGAPIKRPQHEKFARGFEQYLREGVAPSPALARAFSKFKDWLTTIYQTIKGLGQPINEDIRGVFDRMLAETPQRTIYAPDREPQPSIADIHEADAEETEPPQAEAARDRVVAERDQYVAEQPPEIANELAAAEPERTADAGAEPGREAGTGPSGGDEVGAGGAKSDAIPGGGAGGNERGSVQQGGGATDQKGAGLPSGSQFAPIPREQFSGPESDLVDNNGNVRIENLTNERDLAEAISESALRNNGFQDARGEPVTKGQMMALAEAMGMDASKVSEKTLGKMLGGTHDLGAKVLAARKLVVDSARIVSAAAKKASDGGGQEKAAFAAAIARHDMIQSHLAGVTAEWGRAGSAFHSLLTGWDEAKTLNQTLKEITGRDLNQIDKLAKLMSTMDDTHQISQSVLDTRRPTWGRGIVEYYINCLISGPPTHITYVIGNAISWAERNLIEAPLAERISAMHANGEIPRGETAARLAGARAGLVGSLKAVVDSARTGSQAKLPGEKSSTTITDQAGHHPLGDEFNIDAGMRDLAGSVSSLARGFSEGIRGMAGLVKSGETEWNFRPGSNIPDLYRDGQNVAPIGTLLTGPGRMVSTIHSLFRCINYSTEIGGLAYRQAVKEGLTGDALAAQTAHYRSNPTNEMMEQAIGATNDATLMGQSGAFMEKLYAITNHEFALPDRLSIPGTDKSVPFLGATPLIKFIIPFARIGSNIVDQSLVQRTPLGILSGAIRDDLSGKNGAASQANAQARMLAGTALAVSFGLLKSQGFMSGSAPTDPKQRAAWVSAGNQAHSIRIGDTWYQINKLGPMGMLASLSADMYDAAHQLSEGQASAAGSALVHAIAQNVLDQNFMTGVAQWMDAIENSDSKGQAFVQRFAASFLPFSVGMAQMAKAQDPYQRQVRSMLDAFKVEIPGLSESLYPRRDVWGQPIPNQTALATRGLTAIYEQKISTGPVNQAMFNLGVFPADVSRRIRNVKLTDQQYDDYARISGIMAKQNLDKIVGSQEFQYMPPDVKQNLLTATIAQCREAARGVMMMKYPQIVVQATQAKLAKLKGNSQ